MSDRETIHRAIEALSVSSDEEADRRDKGGAIDAALEILHGGARPSAWTREPPTLPGEYFVRWPDGEVHIHQLEAIGWFAFNQTSAFTSHELAAAGVDFWPDPIRPPEG